MGTAKKLPGDIAKRWKNNKKSNLLEDTRWKELETKNTKPAMLETHSGKRAKKTKPAQGNSVRKSKIKK